MSTKKESKDITFKKQEKKLVILYRILKIEVLLKTEILKKERKKVDLNKEEVKIHFVFSSLMTEKGGRHGVLQK